MTYQIVRRLPWHSPLDAGVVSFWGWNLGNRGEFYQHISGRRAWLIRRGQHKNIIRTRRSRIWLQKEGEMAMGGYGGGWNAYG